MLSIKKSSLPEFLRCSELIKHNSELFESNDNESISVPKQYYIETIDLGSINNLDKVLDVLRYWQVDKLPKEIYEFVRGHSKTHKEELLKILKRFNDYSCANELKAIVDFTQDNIIGSISLSNNFEFLSYLHKHNYDLEQVLNMATMKGKIDIVKHVYKLLHTDSEPDLKKSRKDNGHYNEQYNIQLPQQYFNEKKKREVTIDLALYSGSVEIVEFFRNHNYVFDEKCLETIADYGHVSLLKWYKSKILKPSVYGNEYRIRQAMEVAIKNNHLDCIRFFCENMDYKWTSNECNIAGEHGHLEILKYLHESGCPWEKKENSGCGILSGMANMFNPNLVTIIAGSGHLDCLKYVHENGCELKGNILFEIVISKGQHEVLQYLCDNDIESTSLQFIKQHKDDKTKEDYHKCLDIFKRQIDKFYE